MIRTVLSQTFPSIHLFDLGRQSLSCVVCRLVIVGGATPFARYPKLYWIDQGLVRAAKKLHEPIAPRGTRRVTGRLRPCGRTARTTICSTSVTTSGPHPANRTEVDFLLDRGAELAVIEVKSQLRYHTGMPPGLRAIETYPLAPDAIQEWLGTKHARLRKGTTSICNHTETDYG